MVGSRPPSGLRVRKNFGLEAKATFADQVSGQSRPRCAGPIRERNFRLLGICAVTA